MLEKLKYINHLNEEVVFGEKGLIVGTNDLRNFVWSYNSQFSKIQSFAKKIVKKTLPFVIYGGSEFANRTFETFEKDVLAGKAGRLYIGDYYIKGYFCESKKSVYHNGIIKGTLSFVTDQNSWIKETDYTFRMNDETLQQGLGYSYDYPYDFTPMVNVQGLNNTSFTPCEFIMTMFGPAKNPTININGSPYHVDVELLDNEYLVINSYEKTIVKVDTKGNKSNEFHNRDIDNYVFKKIDTGDNKITTNQDMDYNITLLLERSEPAWT